jgi:hypothetical protein
VVASLAQAAVQLHELDNGTRLAVGMSDGKVSISADGMTPIELNVPVGDLVVTDELRKNLYDIVLAARSAAGLPRGWTWLAASMFAAEEVAGISL